MSQEDYRRDGWDTRLKPRAAGTSSAELQLRVIVLSREASIQLVAAIAMQKRSQRAAQFRRQILFPDGFQQRERGLVGLELGDAAGTRGEVAFEIGVDVRRQVMFEIVREEPDDVGARTVVMRMSQ